MGRLALMVVLAVTWTHAALAGSFEVLEQDDQHVRIAFELGSYELRPHPEAGRTFQEIDSGALATTTEVGLPVVPVFPTTIALPPGHDARIEVVDMMAREIPNVAIRPFPEPHIAPFEEGEIEVATEIFRIDESYYDSRRLFPANVVDSRPRARFRHLDVIGLRVQPFQALGGYGLRVVDRLVVDIHFVPLREAEARVPVTHPEPRFDKIYRKLITNHEQAREWRTRKAQVIPRAVRRLGRVGAAPEVKIDIDEVGLVRVNHATLRSIGWTETPLVEDVQLTLRDYDPDELDDVDGNPFIRTPVGVYVRDRDGNGRFDGSDHLVFYGQDARTQKGWQPPQDRYGTTNVYWLTWESGAGTTMPSRTATPSGTPDAEPESFEHWEHRQDDDFYHNYSLNADDAIRLRQRADHLFMNFWNFYSVPDGEKYGVRLRFDVWDRVPGSPVGFRTFYQGVGSEAKLVTASLRPGTDTTSDGLPVNEEPFRITSTNSYTFDSGGLTLSPDLLGTSGAHTFVTRVEDPRLQYVSVSWFDVGYRRSYRAVSGRLPFNSDGQAGHVRFAVDGLAVASAADVLVLSLESPEMPIRLAGGTLAGDTLTFDETGLTATPRHYVLGDIPTLPAVAASAMEVDVPSSIGARVGGVEPDYLLVVYDEFEEDVADLVAWREQHGLTVEAVRVSDVYDEFAGGRFTPEAIREYVRYRYRLNQKPPTYLCLVGDASDAYLNNYRWNPEEPVYTSHPNYVPTFTVLGNVTDGQGKPLIASDHWFIANPDGTDDLESAYFSDLMVGRLPTGSSEQTRDVVAKIIQYESDFQGDPVAQSWRRRGLLIADDCHSTSSGSGGELIYLEQPGEDDFVATSDASIDSIRAAGFEDFEFEKFYLSDILNPIPELGRPPDLGSDPPTWSCHDRDVAGCNWECTRRYARNVLDLDGTLVETLNAGHLFVAYQGHGNRAVITHEWAMMAYGYVNRDPGQVADGHVADVQRLQNYRRWPVYFFFACHVAEFSRPDEGRLGDCLAERLLFNRDNGAIAVVASSGFEWLHANRPVHLATFSSWFSRPDLADDLTGDPTVRLGEIMLGAKNLLAAVGDGNYDGMVESYITLGDPALNIDIAPPRLKVWRDGGKAPWDDPELDPMDAGAPLIASDPDDPTAVFSARVFDEVPVAVEDVRVGVRSEGTTAWMVQGEDYTITSGEVDDLGYVREHTLTFTTTIEPRSYDLVFEATDYNERRMEAAFPARVLVRFYDVTDSGDPRELVGGALVAPESRIRVEVQAPAGLAGDDIAFLVNGAPSIGEVERVPLDEAVSGAGNALGWALTTVLDPSQLVDGSNRVAVEWTAGTAGSVESSLQIITEQDFRIDRIFVYPNPFASRTDFFYRVTQAASAARVKLYTLTGRLIRTLDQTTPLRPDLNRIDWDGRDEDGDEVANGVYFYRMTVTAPDGRTTTEQGKVARVFGQASAVR